MVTSAYRLVPTFDGTHAGEVEPCPTCLKRIAFGSGVTHGWHRMHDWCVPIRRLN